MTLPLAAAPAEFEQRVHKALKFWYDSHPHEGLLDDLLVAQRTAQRTAQRAGRAQTLTQRQRTNLLLDRALVQLAVDNPRDAELLRLRFCAGTSVEEARRQMNYAESTIYSKQNHAISRLAAILYGLEVTTWHERAAQIAGRLEFPCARPVGLEAQVDSLVALLRSADGPWLLSIEGIGGIGKTTLAAAVMRRLAAETAYEEFGWVSAQTTRLDICGDLHARPHPALTCDAILAALAAQLLPANGEQGRRSPCQLLARLRQRLAQTPHLIIIDNFETLLNPEELLPILHSLANPSKFILTSRRRLLAEPSIHLHAVPELNAEHALLLLRQAAEEHELPALLACADEDLLPIYTAVGGNPLALLLIVGQTHVRPLHTVLADLAQARTQPLAALFDYIYRQMWDKMHDCDRRVLLAVASPQVTDLDAASLGILCRLDLEAVTASLQWLIQANLVTMQGNLDICHYRVHNLTYRFLQGVAACWCRERHSAACPGRLP